MTTLIEKIQANLGYAPLHKIDPNSQETIEKKEIPTEDKLPQAAIPAVLTAIYKFTKTEEGCKAILSSAPASDWLDVIYEGNESGAVDKVSQYAGVSADEAERNMENIADEAVRLIKEQAGENGKPDKVKTFIKDQRHSILVHLPAAMQLGDLLNDEALDDRTNKMEGPISNLIHKIEDKFSGGGESKYP